MQRLCRLEEIPLNDARGFDPGRCGEDSMFVLRQANTVRAFENVCPHAAARLEYRKDKFLSADGRSIVCYAHGALFDAMTGACTRGACVGMSLRSLPCYERDGWIWVQTP